MNKFKPIKLRVVAEIDPFEVVSGMSYDEAIEFICGIDLAFADVGFTENIVKRLINSMKDDLSEDEWKPYEELLKYDKLIAEIEPLEEQEPWLWDHW